MGASEDAGGFEDPVAAPKVPVNPTAEDPAGDGVDPGLSDKGAQAAAGHTVTKIVHGTDAEGLLAEAHMTMTNDHDLAGAQLLIRTAATAVTARAARHPCLPMAEALLFAGFHGVSAPADVKHTCRHSLASWARYDKDPDHPSVKRNIKVQSMLSEMLRLKRMLDVTPIGSPGWPALVTNIREYLVVPAFAMAYTFSGGRSLICPSTNKPLRVSEALEFQDIATFVSNNVFDTPGPGMALGQTGAVEKAVSTICAPLARFALVPAAAETKAGTGKQPQRPQERPRSDKHSRPRADPRRPDRPDPPPPARRDRSRSPLRYDDRSAPQYDSRGSRPEYKGGYGHTGAASGGRGVGGRGGGGSR